ncbi:hypothetical protein PMAC_001268 [Pneumocystis sp. 'macacae']|nr:hypothetical protein PMAC_001268 [Pneumocystis sp. 'macacae']
MSKLAKTTFFVTTTITFITISAVHYIQQIEKDRMYEGVLRDEARQAVRKQHEKELVTQEQKTIYKKNKTVTINMGPTNDDKKFISDLPADLFDYISR